MDSKQSLCKPYLPNSSLSWTLFHRILPHYSPSNRSVFIFGLKIHLPITSRQWWWQCLLLKVELLQSSNIWNFFRNQSQSKWSPVATILSLSATPPGQHQTKLRGSVALVLYLIRSITFAQINGECNTCLYYEVLPDIEGLNNTLPSICRCHPTLSAPVIKIAIWRRTKAWRISHLNRIPFSIIHSRASSFQLWKPRGKWNGQRVGGTIWSAIIRQWYQSSAIQSCNGNMQDTVPMWINCVTDFAWMVLSLGQLIAVQAEYNFASINGKLKEV